MKCQLFLLSSSTASVITGNPSINSLNGNGETISVASSPKPDRQRRRRRDPVNINAASIFQLMTVDGITQELAAHIVHYRERKVIKKGKILNSHSMFMFHYNFAGPV